MIALAMTVCFTSCDKDDDAVEDKTQRGVCLYIAISEELKNNIDFSGGATITTPDGKSITQQLTFKDSTLEGLKGYVCQQSLLSKQAGTFKVKVNAKAKSPVQASADEVDWAFCYSAGACASKDGGQTFSSLNIDQSIMSGFGLPKDRFENKVNSVVKQLSEEVSLSVK